MMTSTRSLVLAAALTAFVGLASCDALAADPPTAPINATSLHQKVLCGYQGWFRCAGDEAREGWRHWSRNSRRLTAESVTVEMWPDLSEYTAEEKFPVPGFMHKDGTPAHLFSSVQPRTTLRHFEWMQQYGIDGVFLQRFLVEAEKPSSGLVLKNVRSAAAKTGRTYALCYDLSGFPAEKIVDTLLADWQRLVDIEKITQDKNYLHHNGRPVLFVWGFYSDRFSPAIANRLIDGLKQASPYQVTLIGGCQWYWRREANPEGAQVFLRFDVLSPWNDIPRLGGDFFWRQFSVAADLKLQMAYVAMFDEVDEATAIFKVTNDPPAPGKFQTYEGLPPDWYLRLTGAGTKLLRGEIPNQRTLPIRP